MKTKKLFIILGFVGILILLIIGVYYFGFRSQTIYVNNIMSHGIPAVVYSIVDSRCSCNPSSIYDKALGDYSQRVNAIEIYSQTQAENWWNNNDRFVWEIGLRCSNHGDRIINLDEGIPPQIRCDGTFDCNFGYTNREWGYNQEKGLCFPEILIYRLENNLCSLKRILPLERQSIDYDTLAECKANIVIPEPPTPPTQGILANFFQGISDWFKWLFGG